MIPKLFGQYSDIVLGAFDMASGLRIPVFSQGGQAVYGGVLGKDKFFGPLPDKLLQMVPVLFEFQVISNSGFDQTRLNGLGYIVNGGGSATAICSAFWPLIAATIVYSPFKVSIRI